MRALEQELATQISPWRYAAFRARRKVSDSARQLRGQLQQLLPGAGR